MITAPVEHRQVPNRRFQQNGRHFVLRRFWWFPLWPPLPNIKKFRKSLKMCVSFHKMSRDRSTCEFVVTVVTEAWYIDWVFKIHRQKYSKSLLICCVIEKNTLNLTGYSAPNWGLVNLTILTYICSLWTLLITKIFDKPTRAICFYQTYIGHPRKQTRSGYGLQHWTSFEFINLLLQWRHNGCDGVSNHQPHGCLLNHLFGRRSKKTSKLRVTGHLCGEFTGPRWILRTNGQ